MIARHQAGLVALVLLAACAPREPLPPAEPGSPPVVRHPAEPLPPAPPPVIGPAPSSPAPPPLAGIVVPPEAIYVCVTEAAGQRSQTVIEFAPRVLELCRRHPEMGPCQYERNLCRSRNGRVFAANGQEITLATEAEYDRKVRRVRFQSN